MNWWDTYFDNNYLKLFSYTEKSARFEVESLVRLLNLKPPKKILDLCCGFGRHAIVLAGKGFDVTGLDLSETILQQARLKAEKLRIKLDLEKRDMRDIQYLNEFDVIINLFTAFGFFDSESEDLLVLQGIHRALKPDGQFVIDTINCDFAIQARKLQSWNIDNGSVILEERFFDFFKSRLEIVHHIVENNGQKEKLESSFRLYTLKEMLDLFSRSGLTLTEVYGDFDGSQYSAQSPRMILVARREN